MPSSLIVSAANSLSSYICGVGWSRPESACGDANLLASLSNHYPLMRLIFVVGALTLIPILST